MIDDNFIKKGLKNGLNTVYVIIIRGANEPIILNISLSHMAFQWTTNHHNVLLRTSPRLRGVIHLLPMLIRAGKKKVGRPFMR